MSERIGFIGLGNMGQPMALNLLKAGFELHVYNRNPAKAEPLVAQGAQQVSKPGEVAEPGGIVITMVANDSALESVVLGKEGFLERLGQNGIDRSKVIDMLGQTGFACPIYQNYGKAIAEKRYTPPGFYLSLGLKDVGLVLQTADSAKVPMPFASLLHDRFLASVAKGRGDMDWSALALGVSDDAGLSK